MKITTYALYDMATGELLEESFYEHDGPVSEAKGKGGGGSTQTIQKADPWIGVQPYLEDFYTNTDSWYDNFKGGWFPGSPLVDYRNSNFNAGTNYTWGNLQNLYNTQRAQRAPIQNLTNMFGRDLSNPYATNIPKDMATAYSTPWGALSASPYLNEAAALSALYRPESMGEINPYLETQVDAMRRNANKQLDQQLLANQDLAQQAGQLGSSRDVMGEMVLQSEGNKMMAETEAAMREAAWREALAQENQYAMNALGQTLGYGQGQLGTQAGYLSNLNEAALGYQGDRQSNWLDYLADADKTQAVMYGMAPQIYGMNQAAQLAPYQTGLQMGEFQYGLGQQATDYAQALRNNDIARYEYNRDLWANKLNQMSAWLHGMSGYGTTTTSAESPSSSPWLNALGGGMMGYNVANTLGNIGFGMMGAGSSSAANSLGYAMAGINPLWGALAGIGFSLF